MAIVAGVLLSLAGCDDRQSGADESRSMNDVGQPIELLRAQALRGDSHAYDRLSIAHMGHPQETAYYWARRICNEPGLSHACYDAFIYASFEYGLNTEDIALMDDGAIRDTLMRYLRLSAERGFHIAKEEIKELDSIRRQSGLSGE